MGPANLVKSTSEGAYSADVQTTLGKFPRFRLSPASLNGSDDEQEPHPAELQAKESAQQIVLKQEANFKELMTHFNQKKAAMAQFLESGAEARTSSKIDLLLEELGSVVASKDESAQLLLNGVKAEVAEHQEEIKAERKRMQAIAGLLESAAGYAEKLIAAANDRGAAELSLARIAIEEERASERKMLGEMQKEVQEARRIKMLHHPTRAMDLDHEIEGLKKQLAEKNAEVAALRKEVLWFYDWQQGRANSAPPQVNAHKKLEKTHYTIEGIEELGTTLSLTLQDSQNNYPPPSHCAIQWHRSSLDGTNLEPIVGATRPQYAPEPLDVGRMLTVKVETPGGEVELVETTGGVEQAPGLEKYVEELATKGGADFSVVVVQINDEPAAKGILHMLEISTKGLKLKKGRKTVVKELYNDSVQVCGTRGGGDAAASGLFVKFGSEAGYMLACESERERNAAVMLARHMASLKNFVLLGPGDHAAPELVTLNTPTKSIQGEVASEVSSPAALNGPRTISQRLSFVFNREKTGS